MTCWTAASRCNDKALEREKFYFVEQHNQEKCILGNFVRGTFTADYVVLSNWTFLLIASQGRMIDYFFYFSCDVSDSAESGLAELLNFVID